MSDRVAILIIRFNAEAAASAEESFIKKYITHEIIWMERGSALRFIYEMYKTLPNAAGLKVEDDKRTCVGVESQEAIYELIGG